MKPSFLYLLYLRFLSMSLSQRLPSYPYHRISWIYFHSLLRLLTPFLLLTVTLTLFAQWQPKSNPLPLTSFLLPAHPPQMQRKVTQVQGQGTAGTNEESPRRP